VMDTKRLLPCTAVAALLCCGAVEGAPIPVQEPPPERAVDFLADIAPFLADNCVSCHSKSTHKGGLNLETAADILKGGDSGPAAIPAKGAESPLLEAARHADADAAMPPRDNKVKAKNLTPAQLGLLKRWIDQGAKPGRAVVRELKWQPLPPHLRSIFAVAVSPDGRFAACSRSNRLFVYDTLLGREVFRTEAHPDQVQSLVFSPDGGTLVSGGFRELKLWKREASAPARVAGVPKGLTLFSEDGQWTATADGASVTVRAFGKESPAPVVFQFTEPVVAMAWDPAGAQLAVVGNGKKLAVWSREQARLGTPIELPAAAKALAWRADGKAVHAAGGDAVVREWDVAAGTMVRERKGHPSEVVALARVGTRLVSGGTDGAIFVWDGDGAEPAVRIKAPVAVTAVSVNADGSRILAGCADQTARLFDAAGKVLASVKGDPAATAAVALAQRKLEMEDGTVAYRKEMLAEADKAVQGAKDRVKKTAEAAPAKAKDVETKQKALDDAKTQLAAADKKVADAEAALKAVSEPAPVPAAAAPAGTPSPAPSPEGDAKPAVPAAAPAPDPAKLAEAAKAAEAEIAKRTAALKTAKDEQEAAAKRHTTAGEQRDSAEKGRIAAAHEAELAQAEEKTTATAAEKAKGELAAQEAVKTAAAAELEARKKAAAAAPAITEVLFSEKDGVLVVGHGSGLVQVCSATNAAVLGSFGDRREQGGAVRGISCAGGVVAAAVEDGAAWRWPLAEGWKLARTLGDGKSVTPLRDRVLTLAFSPDGSLLAAGGGDPSREGEIVLWKTAALDAAPARIAGVHSDTVLSLAFSPDGKALVTGGADKTARVVDVASGKVVKSFEGHTHHVLGVAWSPEGRAIVTAGADNSVKTWDVATGTRRKSVEGVDKEVTAVRFLGAGNQFVAASGDGKVRVLARDGTVAKTMSENGDFVNAIAVPVDGARVLAGGDDGVLRLWNPADGAKAAEFREAQ
jgi:WD40 repeat protein